MINPQSYFLRRVRYKSWIISLNAVCALRPDDTVAPPRAHRAEGLLHKNGSYMRTGLRSSPTPTPSTSATSHRVQQRLKPGTSVSCNLETPAENSRMFLFSLKYLLTYLYVIGGHRCLLNTAA
jgi:hypothetical protein